MKGVVYDFFQKSEKIDWASAPERLCAVCAARSSRALPFPVEGRGGGDGCADPYGKENKKEYYTNFLNVVEKSELIECVY